MLQTIIDFFSLQDYNIRYVVVGSVLLSASAALVGSFIFLKKKALIGDAVSHSVLPGICIAFLVMGTKNTLGLIIGAFLTGWLSLSSIDYIIYKTKLKKDAAIGLILSIFFGLGIVLLTFIQQTGNAAQSGLDNFIFGKAAAMTDEDIYIFGAVALVIFITIFYFFEWFTLIAFDVNFAYSLGIPVKTMEMILTALTILAVVTGITSVGVVLMAAMLITPPAAARFWTDSIRKMIAIAVIIGVVSGIFGAFISYIAPSMPTGPWMVVISSLIAFFSFIFAPKKGYLPMYLLQKHHRRTIAQENTLKAFYHLGEKDGNFRNPRELNEIFEARDWASIDIYKNLKKLKRQGWINKLEDKWILTDEGKQKSARIIKMHRLWELYLNKNLNIASDHVHDDAETIEHIITPELEKELEKELGYPEKDPHNEKIPKI